MRVGKGIYFALSTLCETEKGGMRMMREGVAKKEMARRTGLNVQSVRKYLKMIEEGKGDERQLDFRSTTENASA